MGHTSIRVSDKLQHSLTTKSSLRWTLDVGQENLAHYHGDVFIGWRTAYMWGCWAFFGGVEGCVCGSIVFMAE